MSPQEYLLNRALKYLTKRPRSEYEVATYLQRVCDRFPKFYATEMIDGVLEKLREHKYIDDREFARWWVSSQSEFRPRSSYALSVELKRKHIEPDLIKEMLQEAAVDDYSLAKNFLEKKIKTAPLSVDDKKKLFAKAARRGFSYAVIQKAFEEIAPCEYNRADS